MLLWHTPNPEIIMIEALDVGFCGDVLDSKQGCLLGHFSLIREPE